MKNDNRKNIIIGLLFGIIVILIALVVLLATGTISFKSNDVDNKEINQNVTDNNQTIIINSSDAETILKNLYNDAVRHIYNQGVSYCGEYAIGDNTTLSLNGFSYSKSATFNSFSELEKYLKEYMTETLLASSNYNKTIESEGTTIKSYYEKDGSLYCNGWNKGGNMGLTNYLINESSFEVSNITEKSFDGTISAVYSDVNNNNKTTKTIKVSVVKQNNIWLLNTYEEQ